MATPIPRNHARITLDDAARITAGTILARGASAELPSSSITTDSRAVSAGGAFVALRGETHDGHAFLDRASAAGAAWVVVDRTAPAVSAFLASQGASQAASSRAVGVLATDDTLVALGDLARAHLERWRSAGAPAGQPAVVAITGSAGKTTTKELTAALLGAVATTHFTAGNLNNRIGVPAMVLTLEASHRFTVLEMGMSLPGEIAAVAAIARPDVAIVTNVGLAHAEGVGGREGVMREKGAVYRALGPSGVAVVNADDPFVIRAADEAAAVVHASRRLTFGRAAGADYRLVSRAPHGFGSRLELATPCRTLTLHLPLPGEASALDLAAALAAQEAVSGVRLEPSAIDAALASIDLAGRARVLRLGGDVIVLDDTYNANPASMRSALETLAEIGEGRRKVVILGEMKELGDHGEAEHRALGAPLAATGIDLAIGCGGLIDLALEAAERLGVQVIRGSSTADACAAALLRVAAGDAVLVKGSRSVGTERVVSGLSEAWPTSAKPASSPVPR